MPVGVIVTVIDIAQPDAAKELINSTSLIHDPRTSVSYAGVTACGTHKPTHEEVPQRRAPVQANSPSTHGYRSKEIYANNVSILILTHIYTMKIIYRLSSI